MGSSDSEHPQFFKVFLPDHCSQNLRIPDAFQDRIVGKIPNRVVIKNCIDKLWPVDVAEIGNGLYFQGGWSRFVMDNFLTLGEFMVFRYNGHHFFDVLILGTNGCERKPVEEEEVDIHGEPEVDEEETDEGKFRDVSGKKKGSKYNAEESQEGSDKAECLPQENPSFSWKMGQTKHDNLYIPQGVIKGFHLKFGKNIVLQDPEGRKWQGEVRVWQQGTVWITKGWKLLCQSNKIGNGDTVICEFLTGRKKTCETMKVHISRS